MKTGNLGIDSGEKVGGIHAEQCNAGIRYSGRGSGLLSVRLIERVRNIGEDRANVIHSEIMRRNAPSVLHFRDFLWNR
jgi:hypothetical protein